MNAVDYAHTNAAEKNRRKKAQVLADAARELGLMPYELQTLHGTAVHASMREQVRKHAGLDRPASVDTWNQALIRLEAAAFRVPGVRFCERCDFPVLWVKTVGGKDIALDPFPHPLGTVWPSQTPDGARARVFGGGDTDRPGEDVPLYRQHVRSCPETPAGRRSRIARCDVCHNPLYMPLVAIDPTYTTHPNCEPEGGEPR